MDPILGMLSTKEPISGERLCEQLGMTRAAVWKRMEKLRAEGYRIVSAGKLGYRLDPEENSLLPGYLLHELDTRWAGRGGDRLRGEDGFHQHPRQGTGAIGRAVRQPGPMRSADSRTGEASAPVGNPRGRGADAVAGA